MQILDIHAIIYDLLYRCTDAAPDARLFSSFGKAFKKRFYFNTVKGSLYILVQCHFTKALI